ncbi:hypothetical protein PIB30_062963 [Stylosanthes scabra]|uniref:Uncharacterized protein n=1 Tax=Stylosanthes scabra TaxID=79078 RepID=A0ABU6WP14_9FABA|nr:hypothetical protein [Stylosanthes scabra]
MPSPPQSYTLSMRDDQFDATPESKCAFLVVALCPWVEFGIGNDEDGGRGFNAESCANPYEGKTKQFGTMVTMLEEMGEKGLLTMEIFSVGIKAFAAAKVRKKLGHDLVVQRSLDF